VRVRHWIAGLLVVLACAPAAAQTEDEVLAISDWIESEGRPALLAPALVEQFGFGRSHLEVVQSWFAFGERQATRAFSVGYAFGRRVLVVEESDAAVTTWLLDEDGTLLRTLREEAGGGLLPTPNEAYRNALDAVLRFFLERMPRRYEPPAPDPIGALHLRFLTCSRS